MAQMDLHKEKEIMEENGLKITRIVRRLYPA